TDNCDASPEISLAQQPSPGTEVNGDGSVTTITITAADAAGNTTTCSFELLLEDNSPPTISCPPSEVLAVDAACAASVPDFTTAVTVLDNCSTPTAIMIVQDLAAGTLLTGAGTSRTVTLTATDAAGNAATCTVDLELDDRVPPTVLCPANQDLSLDPTGCSVSLPDLRSQLTLADNCTEPLDLDVQQMPAAGTTLTGANTTETILFTVEDGNGNSANCSVEVTLRDVTNPMIDCPAPDPLALGVDCKVVLPDYTSAATVSDDCAMGIAIRVSQSPAPGTEFSFDGEQLMVTLTADDGNGNISSCTFPVTAEDMAPPIIVCPEDREEQVSASCDLTLPDYTSEASVLDNCSEAAGITVSQSPAPGTLLGQDQLNLAQTITLTATDQAGNTESCTFTITPVDRRAPEIICPGPQLILLDVINCEAVLGDLTGLAAVTDNCSTESTISLSQDIPAGTVYAGLTPPEVTVTLTAEDESGNSASCPVLVRIRDQEPPTV
ncbi:MAG: HYR domain-containing protein, partial [Bacteroidota bacterium]